MLYGWVYVLNSKQQAVVMENERLKNENLTTRYNMLVGQINPHFFFNSLNRWRCSCARSTTTRR